MNISKQFLAIGAFTAALGSAHAADLPVRKAAPMEPFVSAATWTGFYIGAHIGGGWAENQTTIVQGNASFPSGTVFGTQDLDGFLAGGYAGWNYQFGPNFVMGIEGDYSWANLKGSRSDRGPTGFTSSVEGKIDWIATVAGRLGYAANNWLFFVKGGWAWAGFEGDGVTTNAGGIPVTNTFNSNTRDGWLLGVGVEWSFARNWSTKLQYEYVDFGTTDFNNTNVSIPGGVITTPARSANSELHMVKLGAAYRF